MTIIDLITYFLAHICDGPKIHTHNALDTLKLKPSQVGRWNCHMEGELFISYKITFSLIHFHCFSVIRVCLGS